MAIAPDFRPTPKNFEASSAVYVQIKPSDIACEDGIPLSDGLIFTEESCMCPSGLSIFKTFLRILDVMPFRIDPIKNVSINASRLYDNATKKVPDTTIDVDDPILSIK